MKIDNEDLRQQLLYEYWFKRDTWLLRREAVPLLLGLDPERVDHNEPEIAGLWETIRQSVEEGSLTVFNRQAPVESWSVTPEAVYRWAGDRAMPLPEPFSSLMEFILKTVKKEDSVRQTENHEAESFNEENETILGAALAVINAFPEACRKKDGSIDVRKTILQINDHANVLLGREDLGFTYERVYDLLKNRTDKLR